MRTIWMGLLLAGCSGGFELDGTGAPEDGGVPDVEVPDAERDGAPVEAGADDVSVDTPVDVSVDVEDAPVTVSDASTEASTVDVGVDAATPDGGADSGQDSEPEPSCPVACVQASYLYSVTGVSGPGLPSVVATCPVGATLSTMQDGWCDCYYSATPISTGNGWSCKPAIEHECVVTIRCDGLWCPETEEPCVE